jgi:hypothetical protein
MYERHLVEVEEFLAALKAKPINVNPTPYSQRRIELQRSGNGKARP